MSKAESSNKELDDELLAQQREATFKAWLQKKEIRDKALELFDRLNKNRAVEDDSLLEVAITLCAVDKLLEADERTQTLKAESKAELKSSNSQAQSAKEEQTKKANKKNMKTSWLKWTMENHTFNMVKLSEEDVAPLSGGVKEFLEKDESGTGWILPSLKCSSVAKPKKADEKPKPLTNDQKLQNAIFLRECKVIWTKAKIELNNRILEGIKREEITRRETIRKKGISKSIQEEEESAIRAAKAAEKSILYSLSLPRLKAWIEEDEDVEIDRKKKDLEERNSEKKTNFESYVRSKDSLRIKLPPPEVVEALARPRSAPRMGFGKTVNAVRPKGKGGPESTVDLMLMANTGQKYVYATKKGRNGMEGDLEKSRKLLLDIGYVDKKNFDEDPDSKFHIGEFRKVVRTNPVLQEIREKKKKEEEESGKAFDEWVQLKALREQALKMLALVEPPKPVEKFYDGPPTGAKIDTVDVFEDDSDMPLCLDVGKALKKIDRGLFREWAEWSKKVLSPNTAQILWDAFEPIACDVHSNAYSQVRDSFMKLLRPGLDFHGAFRTVVEKRWRRGQAEGGANAEEKDKLAEEMSLSKAEMKKLLLDMGIAMKSEEIRVLVDAFDANGDGRITFTELVEFTGPKRTTNAGASVALGQKCCWRTTCRKTGMPNAYSVSALKSDLRSTTGTLRGRVSIDKSKDKDRGGGGGDTASIASVTGRTEIIQLNNGEKRLRVELAERARREMILQKFKVLKSNTQKDRGGGGGGDDDDGDHYDEDNDFTDNDDQRNSSSSHHPLRKSNNSASGDEKNNENEEKCLFIKWTLEQRKDGIKFLQELTKVARKEEALKAMLKDGTPPLPPSLWSATIHDPDLDDREDVLTTEILLRWAPRKKDLVTFFCLETSGQVGRGGVEAKFREIYKDPPNADPDNSFELKYWVRNLQPATSYAFRIRGVNGFGLGDFTYGTFTTRPSAPPLPKIIKTTPTSVTLRWLFSDEYFSRLAELKNVFELADIDKSGTVSRNELSTLFDNIIEKAAAASSNQNQTSQNFSVSSSINNNNNIRKSMGTNTDIAELLSRLKRMAGVQSHQSFGVVFDMIETNDDEALSFEEFQNFFIGLGWCNSSSNNNATAAGEGGVGMSQSRTSMQSMRTSKIAGLGTVGNATSNGGALKAKGVQYIVERCESEWDGVFKEVMHTAVGSATIVNLSPGQSYRFRVFGTNIDNVPGPYSPSIVVHTMLELPSPPTVATIPGLLPQTTIPCITAKQISLCWKGRLEGSTTRDKGMIQKMLGKWAGSSEDEGGVSIEAAFMNYDQDKSGYIDASELAVLLEDLGVQPTKERLEDAFSAMDKNGDGRISFEEFSLWWCRDDVQYTLKRSEAVLPDRGLIPRNMRTNRDDQERIGRFRQRDKSGSVASSRRSKSMTRGGGGGGGGGGGMSVIMEETSASMAASRVGGGGMARMSITATPLETDNNMISTVPVPIVSYLGTAKKADVAGLEPNRLYHFRLRYIGSRIHSQLSVPLKMMTAPLAPSPPVLCRLGHTSARIKWYPSEYGAYKFVVQLLVCGSGGDWRECCNSPETSWVGVALAPETKYRVRIIALNYQGTPSMPSLELEFTTLKRTESKESLTPKNANVNFVIETTGDVCVGDTVLFSERLFVKEGGVEAAEKGASGVQSVAVSKSSLHPNNKMGTSVRMDMSVTSASAAAGMAGGQPLGALAPGTFIGERTIAAHVLRDNYRAVRAGDGLGGNFSNGKNRDRVIWLEVIWQKASTTLCSNYDLKTHEVIERSQGHIEQFEVFRCPWLQEEGRRPYRTEVMLLDECYWPVDC